MLDTFLKLVQLLSVMYVLQPPPEYRGLPVKSDTFILYRPAPDVDSACRALGTNERAFIDACTVKGHSHATGKPTYVIILPTLDESTTSEDQNRLLEHEVAHTYGWEHG